MPRAFPGDSDCCTDFALQIKTNNSICDVADQLKETNRLLAIIIANNPEIEKRRWAKVDEWLGSISNYKKDKI